MADTFFEIVKIIQKKGNITTAEIKKISDDNDVATYRYSDGRNNGQTTAD